jgi:hypothetical protein
MMEESQSLVTFRERLQGLMSDAKARPFVCHGSPLLCSTFIVGFNPATEMDRPFWAYWSDELGFDKPAFMRDYLEKRSLPQPTGVRARIERIAAQLPSGACLETNICSKPTKTAAELRPGDRTTAIFDILLQTVRPRLVYAHSNQPIAYLERVSGTRGLGTGMPKEVTVGGHTFLVLGTLGPLFRMGFDEAHEVGRKLNSALAG